MSTTDTLPVEVRSETRYGGREMTHIIEFDRAISTPAFREWLEANGWLGYHPAGYGGWSSASGNVGTFTHSTSCD